ncbi:hypothetical protein ACRYCC_04495 [Actinomadura scrupuli]|uniref:hypothetical protein n=1 Tax=Actinomadura scrupuli TaxID=559629 RepID=UPI003D96ABA3
MTTARELIESFDPDDGFLLADGFDEAILGVVSGWWAGNHNRSVILYDYEKCVQVLVGEGMDELEAHEFIEMNLVAAYVGEGTPAFAMVYRQPTIMPFDL